MRELDRLGDDTLGHRTDVNLLEKLLEKIVIGHLVVINRIKRKMICELLR